MRNNFWLAIMLLSLNSTKSFGLCTGVGCDATATSPILSSVKQAISIENISPLDFGDAVAGDPDLTVNPVGSETLNNASFVIKGEANTEFKIHLPRSAWLINIEDSTEKLKIKKFTSIPKKRGNLGSSGSLKVYVGATRKAIPRDAASGQYQGTFSLTVLY